MWQQTRSHFHCHRGLESLGRVRIANIRARRKLRSSALAHYTYIARKRERETEVHTLAHDGTTPDFPKG